MGYNNDFDAQNREWDKTVKKGLETWIIIVIVVGVLFCVLVIGIPLIIVAVIFCCLKKHNDDERGQMDAMTAAGNAQFQPVAVPANVQPVAVPGNVQPVMDPQPVAAPANVPSAVPQVVSFFLNIMTISSNLPQFW